MCSSKNDELDWFDADQVARCLAALPTGAAPFGVLYERYCAGWHGAVAYELSKLFRIEEVTDVNWGRCRALRLHGEDGFVRLDLSLWGPFAYVQRTTGEQDDRSVVFLERSAVADSILQVLAAEAIELLTPRALEAVVEDLEGQQRPLWQVMFWEVD